ncbi:MAG: hypothetical protein ABJC26_13325, partial [Gemmatimonadaceae bacterium]
MRSRFNRRFSGRDLIRRNADQGPALFLAAIIGGLVVGAVGWSFQQHRHRQALFHARPFRRLAALGYLRRHPSV